MAKAPKPGGPVYGQIEGLEDVIAKMANFPKAFQGKVMRPALRAGAKVVKQRVESYAPVRTGALKRSVKVRAVTRSRVKIGSSVKIGEGFFKGDTFYAGFQEFGWRTGKRGSADRRQVAGTRFMRRGLYDSEVQMKQAVIKEARRRLPLVIVKLATKLDTKKETAAEAIRNSQ